MIGQINDKGMAIVPETTTLFANDDMIRNRIVEGSSIEKDPREQTGKRR